MNKQTYNVQKQNNTLTNKSNHYTRNTIHATQYKHITQYNKIPTQLPRNCIFKIRICTGQKNKVPPKC